MHTRLGLIFLAVLAAQALALENASFESRGTVDPWRPMADLRTGKAAMRVVQDAHHEGQQSLMLSTQNGSEAAVGQVITLPAGSTCRARCWIKTKDVAESETAEAGATLQIRAMDGRVLAEAPGLVDAPEWSEVEVVFQMPAAGTAVLSVALVNPGKSTGSAWFDDVRVDRVAEVKYEQKVLNFPILWAQGGPYNKLLPKNANRDCGPWICGQVANAMIARYWSLQTRLRCSGTYWYYRRDTKELIKADYSVPFAWDGMLADLTGIPEGDLRVDPVADFVYRFTVAQRSQWPLQADHAYYYTRDDLEVLVKYFGFDGTSIKSIYFGPYLQTHTWNDLYDLIRKEIDEGRPVRLALYRNHGTGHVVLITGYRKVEDRYEFTIHWGWRGAYNPTQTFRLDQPVGRYDKTSAHHMMLGLQPDKTHEQLPLYNKVAEVWDSDYDAWTASDLLWNPDRREYAAIFPAGPATAQRLYYQRLSKGGLPVGGSVPLALKGNCRKPVMAWSGKTYGVAWEDRTENIGTICFARVSPEDGRLQDAAPIRIGPGADNPWRPSVTIAHNGSEFALVTAVNGRLEFIKISSAGQLLPNSRRTITEGIDPELLWLGDSYVLAYAAGNEVCLVRLSRDGGVQGGIEKVSTRPGRAAFTPKVAWSGKEFGITWEHSEPKGQAQVWFCRADGQCKPIPKSQVEVTGFDLPGRYARCCSIGWRTGEFIVTYRKDDAYLTRLSEKGKVLENRYLFSAPEYVAHVSNGEVALVLYVRPHGQERSVEVETCLFPLGK